MMPIHLLRIRGIVIRFDPSWLFVAFLIAWSLARGVFPQAFPGLTVTTYWLMSTATTLGLFGSILLHELGHALVANRNGIRVREILLFLFGGVAKMQDAPPTPGVELRIAAAGPIVSLALAIATYVAGMLGRTSGWIAPVYGPLLWLGTVNLGLVVFNLLPGFPLDGGRLLRAALWRWRGDLEWATGVSARSGAVIGISLVAIGVISLFTGAVVAGLWLAFVGLFLRSAAVMAYRQHVVRDSLSGRMVRSYMRRDVRTTSPSVPITDFTRDTLRASEQEIFPVIDRGTLVGTIDARRVATTSVDNQRARVIADVMDTGVDDVAIPPTADALDVLARLRRERRASLFVVDGGHLLGAVSTFDLLEPARDEGAFTAKPRAV